MNKILTIAIPTFNRKDYLVKALESIFCQIDERTEVLVSDNCSEDGTKELMESNYPNVTYYRNEKNVGMENFKRCYDRAKGKFILLLGDDDLVVNGALKIILDFLEENNDLKLLFLNHTFFKEEFNGNKDKPFASKKNGNFVTTDKDVFIDIVKHQLSFISCMILSNKAYRSIRNVNIYTKNWFLQTCVAFEITKDPNSKLGIISDVCIAQNTPNSALNMSNYVDVFIVTESSVFTEIGVACGYRKSKMKKIYFDFACSNVPNYVLACKAKDVEWKESFWKKGYPVLKKSPKAWLTIFPAALIPTCIAKLAYKIKHRYKG